MLQTLTHLQRVKSVIIVKRIIEYNLLMFVYLCQPIQDLPITPLIHIKPILLLVVYANIVCVDVAVATEPTEVTLVVLSSLFHHLNWINYN